MSFWPEVKELTIIYTTFAHTLNGTPVSEDRFCTQSSDCAFLFEGLNFLFDSTEITVL